MNKQFQQISLLAVAAGALCFALFYKPKQPETGLALVWVGDCAESHVKEVEAALDDSSIKAVSKCEQKTCALEVPQLQREVADKKLHDLRLEHPEYFPVGTTLQAP